MGKSNNSIAVLTSSKSLVSKLRRLLSGKSSIHYFSSPDELFSSSIINNKTSFIIAEYSSGRDFTRFNKFYIKRNLPPVLFIVDIYNHKTINKITSNLKFSYAVNDASLNQQIKRFLAGSAKPAAEKKDKTLSSENEYLDLLNNSFIGMYRTSPEGKILMCNKAALRIVGCKSLKEVQKINLEEEKYDPFKLRSIFKKTLSEKGEVLNFENRWRTPGGKMIIVRENARAIKDKKGNIIYYEGTFEDITSRLEIEKALSESERILSLAMQGANIGVWNWNIISSEIYLSQEFLRMAGYSSGELLPTIDNFIELFHSEDRHIITQKLLEGVSKEHPDFETELRLVNKENNIRWMLTKGKVTEWSGEIPTNILAIQVDITDRKNSEEKIIENENRFRELAENIEEIFWVLSEREILYISPGLDKIWGVPSKNKKILPFLLYKTVHPEDRERIKRAIRIEASMGPGIFNEEFRIIRPDGIEKWLWAKTFPVKKGNVTYRAVGIAEDITSRKQLQIELERFRNHLQHTVDLRTRELLGLNQRLIDEIAKQKRAETEIENQLKFFRTLIETAASPIFIKDANKKYLDCNRAFEEYFGDKRESIIGKSDSELLPPEIAKRFESVDDALLKNPGELTFEGATKHSPPDRKEYMITKSTYLKSDGSPGGIIAFVTDITQRKKLELNIQKAFNKEKELLEIKSKLISTASHEFRTPLTTILSSIDLIDVYRKRDNLEKYYNHIDKIKSSVKYMIELLNDVMVINKTESGKLEFAPGETDLVELCREIINETSQASTRQTKINFSHKGINDTVYADKKLLRLIISNLLGNAVKYSHIGGEVNLDISQNGQIQLTVTDSGIGIPPDEFAMIYEPFHRGGNVDEREGTGLGLSIVKRCVELHQGKIFFESNLNKGTVFNVQIPIINI